MKILLIQAVCKCSSIIYFSHFHVSLSSVPSSDDSEAASADESHRSRKLKKKSSEYFEIPSEIPSETRVSFSSIKDFYDDDSSFQSCADSTIGNYSELSTSQDSRATESASRSTNSGYRSRRSHRRRHKRLRSSSDEEPSALMKFIQGVVENCGQAAVEFFLFLCSLIKIDGKSTVSFSFCWKTQMKLCNFVNFSTVSESCCILHPSRWNIFLYFLHRSLLCWHRRTRI